MKITFGYYMTKEVLIFIDSGNSVKNIMKHMQNYETTEFLLFDFMECILKEDLIFLQSYEERLTKLEEELLKGKIKDFDRKILLVRKELSALSSYYEQIADVGEVLQQDAAERGSEKRKFSFWTLLQSCRQAVYNGARIKRILHATSRNASNAD